MKKVFFFLGTLAALGIASCGSKDAENDPNLLVNSDFETLAGWLPADQGSSLSHEKAHSGRYSIKVDGTHDYSLTYKQSLGVLHDTRIKKIKVSAWVFVPSADAKASLVVAVSNPAAPDDKPILWEALETGKLNTYGKWVAMSQVITIPDTAVPTNTLGIYLWRTSGNLPIYLDDLRVTAEE